MSKKKLKKKLRKLEEAHTILQLKYEAQKTHADELEVDMRQIIMLDKITFMMRQKWQMFFTMKDDLEKAFWYGKKS
jgi:hypothetical protein